VRGRMTQQDRRGNQQTHPHVIISVNSCVSGCCYAGVWRG
jgi:hypothetical protein